jgi:hypothetical protein
MNLSSYNFLRLKDLNPQPGAYEAELYSRFIQDAKLVGHCTCEMVKILWANQLNETSHAISSFFSLGSHFSDKRLEAASQRVLFYGLDSPHMVKTVLLQNLDSLPLDHKTDIYGQFRLF